MSTYKILIVDDAPFIREILQTYLEGKPLGHHFEVREAENGEEAFNEFITFKPDLILMDIVMPVLSGIESVKKIRALPQGASVPIVGLSTLDEGHIVKQMLDAGATQFVKKPFSLEDLNHILQEHL